MLFVIILTGCSTSNVIGYTYDLDEKNNQVKLNDIYSISYEIKDDEIIGEMKIGNESAKFNATKIDNNDDYDMFHGNIIFNEEEKEFDIAIYESETATGLYYNKSREFVNGFVIEKLSK